MQVHPERAKIVAELSLKMEQITEEKQSVVKPCNEAIKRLKKKIKKLLEKPEAPMSNDDIENLNKGE